MNIVTTIALSTLVLSVIGCSHTQATLADQLSPSDKSKLAKVYQFKAKTNQVSFVVKSHGCTLPEHFELKQGVNKQGNKQLALIRLKQDRCRAMPRAFPVNFKLERPIADPQKVELLNEIETEQKLPRKAKTNNRS